MAVYNAGVGCKENNLANEAKQGVHEETKIVLRLHSQAGQHRTANGEKSGFARYQGTGSGIEVTAAVEEANNLKVVNSVSSQCIFSTTEDVIRSTTYDIEPIEK